MTIAGRCSVKAVGFVASFLSSVGRSWVHDLYFLLQICLKLGEFNPLSCFFQIETVKKRTFYVFKFSSLRCKSIIAVLLLTKFIKPRRKWLVWSRKVQLLVFSGKKSIFHEGHGDVLTSAANHRGAILCQVWKAIYFFINTTTARERERHTHTHTQIKRGGVREWKEPERKVREQQLQSGHH